MPSPFFAYFLIFLWCSVASKTFSALRVAVAPTLPYDEGRNYSPFECLVSFRYNVNDSMKEVVRNYLYLLVLALFNASFSASRTKIESDEWMFTEKKNIKFHTFRMWNFDVQGNFIVNSHNQLSFSKYFIFLRVVFYHYCFTRQDLYLTFRSVFRLFRVNNFCLISLNYFHFLVVVRSFIHLPQRILKFLHKSIHFHRDFPLFFFDFDERNKNQ